MGRSAYSELAWATAPDTAERGDDDGQVRVAYRYPAGAGAVAPAEVVRPWAERARFSLGQWGAGSAARGDAATPLLGLAPAASGQRYDARGRLVEDAQREYVWDGLDRLVEVRRKADGQGAAAQPLARYRYNLFGDRIAKVVYGAQGQRVHYYFYDGAELSAETSDTAEVGSTDPTELRSYVHLDGRPVALLQGRAVYAIHSDHRLAPMAVTDRERRVVWQATLGDNGEASVDRASTLALSLRGSNQIHDDETGLHYNGHRYLEAGSGRYLSPDPLGLAAGPDLYRFALGQPHRYVDPLGLAAVDPNTDISNWGWEERLQHVFERTADRLPNELGRALRELVSPTAIATTVAVFAAWAASQTVPVLNVLVDAGLTVFGLVMLGQAAIAVARELFHLAGQLINGSLRCASQLDAIADGLANALAQATVDASAGAIARLGRWVRRLIGKDPCAPAGARSKAGRVGIQAMRVTCQIPEPKLPAYRTQGCFNATGDAYQRAPDRRQWLNHFFRQVRRQESALNEMTAAEYVAARNAWRSIQGRNPRARYDQVQFRNQYRDSLADDLERSFIRAGKDPAAAAELAAARASEIVRESAALHEPDMFAGGSNSPMPCAIGNPSVNCSIGAQWGSRNLVDELDRYAEDAIRRGDGDKNLNLSLRICGS